MTDDSGQMTSGEDTATDTPSDNSAAARRLPQVFDLGEVAQIFSRKRRTIRWWIATGRLRAVRIGKTPFVPASEIDALLTREPLAPKGDDER